MVSKMAPSVADVSVTLSRVFLFFAILLFILDIQHTHAVHYNRETLLNIGRVHHELSFSLSDFAFLLRRENAAACGPGELNTRRAKHPRRKRGKRAGLHARLKARATRPPLPSLLLANVRSLENKMDELRARITAQREIRECCVLTFTETWLTEDIPDSAIQLESFAAYRGDRTLASGKHRGGGVCVYVNKRWCTDVQTMEKHCSQDIELLMVKCRPFYLPPPGPVEARRSSHSAGGPGGRQPDVGAIRQAGGRQHQNEALDGGDICAFNGQRQAVVQVEVTSFYFPPLLPPTLLSFSQRKRDEL
ncbi:protein-L-isoaspartate(D-aspartate) O-methyltransferase isoform X1 [Dunckerocampus dactyliophorus]|uniref:protein-L-isoaspartate(D-aspartate) O-methyltransferase isoform X1 n=1 Tax=Dunckerocampus dactyliophorus TaxID=161453 RepID=UPI0024058193|nr:protein-L-isoaspartate(D-aspartate) O-methyltransferase isoform X1 [Dunckerocampus dactyliophorus]